MRKTNTIFQVQQEWMDSIHERQWPSPQKRPIPTPGHRSPHHRPCGCNPRPCSPLTSRPRQQWVRKRGNKYAKNTHLQRVTISGKCLLSKGFMAPWAAAVLEHHGVRARSFSTSSFLAPEHSRTHSHVLPLLKYERRLPCPPQMLSPSCVCINPRAEPTPQPRPVRWRRTQGHKTPNQFRNTFHAPLYNNSAPRKESCDAGNRGPVGSKTRAKKAATTKEIWTGGKFALVKVGGKKTGKFVEIWSEFLIGAAVFLCALWHTGEAAGATCRAATRRAA